MTLGIEVFFRESSNPSAAVKNDNADDVVDADDVSAIPLVQHLGNGSSCQRPYFSW